MVAQANAEMFGSCTNIGECEAVCPKGIKLDVIGTDEPGFHPGELGRIKPAIFNGRFHCNSRRGSNMCWGW